MIWITVGPLPAQRHETVQVFVALEADYFLSTEHFCRTSKMSHDGSWRAACLAERSFRIKDGCSTRHDSSRRWLWRLVSHFSPPVVGALLRALRGTRTPVLFSRGHSQSRS